MASLKEVKGRIDSVKGTLKITSAMKLVASAKYHKAQLAAGRLEEYQKELSGILEMLPAGADMKQHAGVDDAKTAVVALSSNSSLCGSFNANVIAKAREVVSEEGGAENVVLYAIGRKVADSFARTGLKSVRDYSELSAHPTYADAAALADELVSGFNEGRFAKVVLVWSHYLSASSQKPTVETFLPYAVAEKSVSKEELLQEYIVEPSCEELYAELLPKTLRLKIFAILLDSAASEHAARMIAMQTATDNGNELLSDLTLEYNKGRQAKITSEILDLAGGAAEG